MAVGFRGYIYVRGDACLSTSPLLRAGCILGRLLSRCNALEEGDSDAACTAGLVSGRALPNLEVRNILFFRFFHYFGAFV